MRVLVVAIAIAVLVPSAAAARTSLRLRVSGELGGTKTATLRCNPTGGTHPHRAAACRALKAAGGRFSKLRGRPHAICPAIVAPVTASATGVYRGRRVRFRHTYTNACEMDRATAPVFDL